VHVLLLIVVALLLLLRKYDRYYYRKITRIMHSFKADLVRGTVLAIYVIEERIVV